MLLNWSSLKLSYLLLAMKLSESIWQTYDSSKVIFEKQEHKNWLNVSFYDESLCMYDKFEVNYEFLPEYEIIHLAVEDIDSFELSYTNLYNSFELHPNEYNGIIKTLINEKLRPPMIDHISASYETNRLILTFSEATNCPDLLTSDAIEEALYIFPAIRGGAVGF